MTAAHPVSDNHLTGSPTAPLAAGRDQWVTAGLVTLLILALHVWLWFHAGAFCGDEVNVINLANSRSPRLMTHDSFPILMPLMVSGWTAIGLGRTDWQLRLFGLLAGWGLTAAFWLAAWRAARRPPWLALILFGLNGAAIYWTDYLRAYGLGSLLVILTIACMWGLLEKPTWKRAAWLGLAAILSVQALYQNAVFFAAIALGGWAVCGLRRDKPAAVKILVAGLAAAGSVLPYMQSVRNWQRGTTIRPGFSWRAALDNLNVIAGFPLPQYSWLWTALGLVAVIVGFMAWHDGGQAARRLRTGEVERGRTPVPRERRVFAAVVLVVSVGGYFAFLKFAALITSPWYFLPLLAIGASCLDLAFDIPSVSRLARLVVVAVMAGTVCVAAPFAVRDLNCRYSNMNPVVQRLLKELSPQDYILVTPWYLGISFHRYYHGDAPWDSLPPVADHNTYRFDLVPASAAAVTLAEQPALDRAASTLRNGHHVWVVGWMSVPTAHRVAATSAGRFLAEHSTSFQAVDLKLKGQTSDYENVSLLEADGWQ
jgi:hypothetical protein